METTVRFLRKYGPAVLVAAVMLPRMAWFIILGGALPAPPRDQGIYIALAGRLLEGEGLSYSSEMGWLRSRMAEETELSENWTGDPEYMFGLTPVETPTATVEPGYALMLAAVFAVFGPVSGSVFFLNCLFSLIGVWAVFCLVRDFWGEKQGYLAALIWSLYPYYIYYSAYAMTDTVHISLLPLVLLLTLRAVSACNESIWKGVKAGAVSAFLFLVRSTAIFLLPLQLLWVMLRRRWKTAAALLATFLLLCLP
ncbi:MAG: hypothetical protein GF388_05700, partial [Candidatus Aegiribacteria sp.]|nr:hypothetical protein [Candidatus Aegiribacteria sp.]